MTQANAKCPDCDRKLDMATPMDLNDPEALPTSGDVTICFYCGSINVYEKDMSMRLAEETDLASLPEEQLGLLVIAQRNIRSET